jgi:hypothetical protein
MRGATLIPTQPIFHSGLIGDSARTPLMAKQEMEHGYDMI